MKAVASLLVLLAAAAPLARAQGAKDRTPLDVAEDLNLSTFLAVLEVRGPRGWVCRRPGRCAAPAARRTRRALPPLVPYRRQRAAGLPSAPACISH